MGKIVFLDIDGTLIDYETKISESAVKAIKEARENNNEVYVCTGRTKPKIPLDKWNIKVDGIIAGNGGYIEDNGIVVFDKSFSKDELKEIIHWLDNKGLSYYVEGNTKNVASKYFNDRVKETINEYTKLDNLEIVDDQTVRDFFPDLIFNDEVIQDDILKVNFILDSYNDYLEAKEKFPQFEVSTWGGKGETALFGDIGVSDISKGKAIKQLIDYKDAEMKNTIGFGDSKVDIPMLEACAFGVAMGNGSEEIKEIADYITDNVEDDGIYKAFKNLDLI